MTPETLAERVKQQRQAIEHQVERLNELDATLRVTSFDQAEVVKSARVTINALVNQVVVLATGLQPYTDPDFYAELRPSLATDDQGRFGAGKLEQAFPE